MKYCFSKALKIMNALSAGSFLTVIQYFFKMIMIFIFHNLTIYVGVNVPLAIVE